MILQRTPESVLAIKQEDHAAFAAFLLEHWSAHNFLHDPEREQIILATREHDNGWEKVDDAAKVEPDTCLPLQFTDVTADQALDIWRRGTRKYIDSDPFVALLITHHAYSIYETANKRNPEWKPFFTEFAQQRAELRNRLGLDHPHVERAYSYLRMMDWFTLAFCMNHELGTERSEQYGGYNYKRAGAEFLFRPYPFDTRDLVYQLPVYPLQPEGYPNDRALRAALKKPHYLEVILNPLGRREK